MTGHRAPTRRQFLALLAAFGIPYLPWRAILGTNAAPGSARAAAERLVGLLGAPASARAVGTAYLAEAPSEAEVTSLVEAIVAQLEGGAEALRGDEGRLRGALLRGIERDFAEEATLCLRGWIVSRTEARLCGLSVLV